MRNIFKIKKKKAIGTGPNVENEIASFPRPMDERIAILEMLLWKYHIEGIPPDVYERFKKYKFVEKHSTGTYGWTPITDELGKKFNKEFNYL